MAFELGEKLRCVFARRHCENLPEILLFVRLKFFEETFIKNREALRIAS
jgi:hypothetical protein